MKQDSATFWGEDGGQGWAAVEAQLDAEPGPAAGSQARCCGDAENAGQAGHGIAGRVLFVGNPQLLAAA